MRVTLGLDAIMDAGKPVNQKHWIAITSVRRFGPLSRPSRPTQAGLDIQRLPTCFDRCYKRGFLHLELTEAVDTPGWLVRLKPRPLAPSLFSSRHNTIADGSFQN